MIIAVIVLAVLTLVLGVLIALATRQATDLRTQLWAQEKKSIEAESILAAERNGRTQLEGYIESEKSRMLQEYTGRLTELENQTQALNSRESEIEATLHRTASLLPEEAREIVLKRIESEVAEEASTKAKQLEQDLISQATKNARKVVIDTIERTATDYVTEATTAVVELPSEDVKGRIIGREGRNIRSFEQITGVDLIIDETPEAVVISSFDPVRREVARLTLMNLILDGRIHPARIEELHEKAKEEVSRTILEAGDRAVDRANVDGLSRPVIETLGRLRFRTSYAQNVLDHSVEVSRMAATLGAELGLNVEVLKRAGLLHDIGKALGPEWEGPHALTGMAYLRQFEEKAVILNAVGAHHREIEPESPEAQIIIIADTLSASRPGARRESLENYIKRLTALEALANDFPGVDRSYAVQAGREIRLIVKPEVLTDAQSKKLATDVAKKITLEMDLVGQIKVIVIRESRFTDVAK